MNLPTPYHQEDAVTIYHGDCRQIMPLLGRFDLLMADPPYGIGADRKMSKRSGKLSGHGHRRVAARHYPESDWDKKPVEAKVMEMAISTSQKQIIFGGNYYELGPCKGYLVWDKQNDGNQFADAELAWNNLNCPVRIKRHLWNGMARKGLEERHHPTQKPLDVIQWCISLAGDITTILDPWAGSGTTGHAAKNLGKKAVLIEREERYCEIAAKRLSQEVLAL